MVWVLAGVAIFQMIVIMGIIIKLENTRALVFAFGAIMSELIDIMKLTEQRHAVERLTQTVDEEFKRIIDNGWKP